MELDFPLIYCNGCSYSDDNYRHPVMENKTYSHVVGKLTGGFVINNSISGSCNRRIIRTSVHDLMLQRQLNPNQRIIALIQLTFEIRGELWLDNTYSNRPEVESHFYTHQFSELNDWKLRLLNNKTIRPMALGGADSKFLTKWSEGRAFFYSSYAERINLLTDIFLFKNLMRLHNIEYVIFQGPIAEKLDGEYLVDFFKQELKSDKNILDFETFSFCNWCAENDFIPIDPSESLDIGHYRSDAHKAFAEKVLAPLVG